MGKHLVVLLAVSFQALLLYRLKLSGLLRLLRLQLLQVQSQLLCCIDWRSLNIVTLKEKDEVK